MEEFENNGTSGVTPENNTDNIVNSPQSTPPQETTQPMTPPQQNVYTQPQQNVFTNPQDSSIPQGVPVTPIDNNGVTYHYSYVNKNNDTFNAGNTASAQQSEQPVYRENAYTNANFTNYTPPVNQPKKKNKTAKVLAVILVICVVIAAVGVGIAISKSGSSSDDTKKPNDEIVTQEDDNKPLGDSEAVTEDSEETPIKTEDGNYTVAGVATECMDSCVGIRVYSNQNTAYDYFYGNNSGNNSSEPTLSGEGSGIIMSESNGLTYIMTCAHVISDSDSFKVTLNNGKEYDAEFVGADAQTDIGVLSIKETGLKIAKFADSDKLVVGEQVVAIGCPGGLEFMNSLTSGYISALARPISSTIGYDTECIQIDAPINPGNSGGALFNMQGQVIGINSSKIAATEYEGIGFSVPSNTAVNTANSLIRVGYVEGRAKIGITYNPITSFNNASAVISALEQKGFKDCQGAMVINEIDPESDLASKDVKTYDMIVAVNGKTMTSQDVVTSILADSEPGNTIKLTIARINGKNIETFEIECKLMESKG